MNVGRDMRVKFGFHSDFTSPQAEAEGGQETCGLLHTTAKIC